MQCGAGLAGAGYYSDSLPLCVGATTVETL